MFYPDVLVTCDPRDLEDEYLVQYPLLIAEVLSPSTSQYDMTATVQIYRAIPTLEEIALINVERETVMLVRRVDAGWVLRDIAGNEGFDLESVGLRLKAGDLLR